ncbi:MAG: hypothetical protein MUP44_05805, partial [Anaerolineales bacterium]|nr:hypothetical protein [Anaerolineales bacterium]
MKRHIQFTLLLIFVLFLAACGADGTPSAPSGNEAPDDTILTASLPNYLVEVEGEIEVRRIGWKTFVPASFGTLLKPGDLIKVADGSTAAVFCGEDSMWDQGPAPLSGDGEEYGVPCQTGRPPRPWPDVAALRGETDSVSAYVIQPRNSALLDATPGLTWHSPTDTGEVLSIVSILSDDGQERSPIETGAGILDWPADWAPLEPGSTYVLLIGDQEAGQESTVGKGFWLLDPSEAATVQSQEARLRSGLMSDAAQDLLVAELYQSHGLNAEAIGLLAALAERNPGSAVRLMLGRLYLESGLPPEAEGAFTEA